MSRAARFGYTLLLYFLTPFILMRLWWRSRANPGYARRIKERFGIFPKRDSSRPALWLHTVSVGEFLASQPLLKQLRKQWPELELVITTTTPTGSDRVIQTLGEEVFHVYCPYDLPDSLARFLNRVQPSVAVIMETELWPNTIAACHSRKIPVILANARLSARSARGYQRFSALTRPTLNHLTQIAAQSGADAQRFLDLGASDTAVQITGSIKFDLSIDTHQRELAKSYRARWQGETGRQVLLAASTHDGEDALLLECHQQLLKKFPQALLVLVPRHPERFDNVARLATQHFGVQKHSEGGAVRAETQVLVGDTMGELLALLGASDCVFMGGTWVDRGGHNFIEPAAWGKPLFAGSSLYNFAEISSLLRDAGALAIVETPEQLAEQVGRLWEDPSEVARVGRLGLDVAARNRGALNKLMDVLAPYCQEAVRSGRNGE